MVKLVDSEGNLLGRFPSWRAADEYRSLNNRRDWKIKNAKPDFEI